MSKPLNVEEYIGFVKKLINRFSFSYSDYDDLFQVGLMGLLESNEKYNPTLGKFTTYAAFYILGELKKYFRKKENYSLYEDDTIFIDETKDERLENAVNSLELLNKKVIIFKYYKKMTQYQIAKYLNISQSSVSRIEKESLILLREII